MPESRLTRRALSLLPLLLAACDGREDTRVFEPLRYDYLPPIPLNVAAVEVEQRFFPSGAPPDVSQLSPVRPLDALRRMAEDRLRPFGTSGRAVLAIQDASLLRRGNTIDGSMVVVLTIYNEAGAPAGFVEARVARQYSGRIDSLRGTLYDMVRAMMDDMNVELEYQIRRNLRDWLVSPTATPTPVEQVPLDGSQPPPREEPPALPQDRPPAL